VLCAVEADRDACRTHEANFPGTALFKGDIRGFLKESQSDVPTSEELRTQGVDLVYGGPPCQGFSQIGPRDLNDPRNLLYQEFVRVIEELVPKAFIMENVPNMVAMRNGHYRNQILEAFKKVGYGRTAILTVLASDYGVPQDRRRIFFIGLQDDVPLASSVKSTCERLLAEQQSKKATTVRQAVSDLPSAVSPDDAPLPYPTLRPGRPADYQRLMRLDCDTPLLNTAWKCAQINGDRLLYNHHTKGIEGRRKRIVKAIKPGKRGDSLPEELWNGTRAHKWRRLDPDRPSYTILAQMHRDLSEWIHPEHDRWITVREAARLQSFHDGFVFHGSEYQQLKQVGNAVPPLLGFAVARVVRRLLDLEANDALKRT
jgi:DNA (cytosine-5)-methyltransferase 1